jgi:glycosyltransferase involved in cell wall biosynthesis
MSDAPDILFVTRKWAPAIGGMETWSHRLSEALAELAPVEIVALPGKANGHPPGTLALLAFPFTVLRRYLSRGRAPQVLQLGDMALWPLGLFALLRRGDTQVVLAAHGTDVSYSRRGGLKGRAYGAYLRLGAQLLRRAKVVANSAATEAAARAHGWASTTVVPLATEMTGEVPDGPPQPYVLFAGRLVERKGCGWFIRHVLPLLPEGLELHVAGTGIDPGEVAALGHPRVRYLGALDQAALARAYRAATCVVVPNIEPANGEFEGFGLVATEAAAAGGVVLAADCGGLPSAIVDGVTGILVPSGQPQAWCNEINAVHQWDRDRRRAFIAGALARTAADFRWPRVAERMMAVYRRHG